MGLPKLPFTIQIHPDDKKVERLPKALGTFGHYEWISKPGVIITPSKKKDGPLI